MPGYLSRFDSWHLTLTLVPLAAALLGALIASRWTRHLGKVVAGYAVACLGVGFAPTWLRAAGLVADGPMQPLLVETKVAFVLGLALVLSAAGRAIQRERSRSD